MAVTFIWNLRLSTTVLKSFNLAAKRPASWIIFVKANKDEKAYTKTEVQFSSNAFLAILCTSLSLTDDPNILPKMEIYLPTHTAILRSTKLFSGLFEMYR
jgi:hypothetical protein